VSRRACDLAVIALVIAFASIGLFGLDAVPRVHEDEPWSAAPGVAFWTTGRFATELSAGFFGAERHEYGFLPVFPLLVGLVLRFFGLSLFGARIVALSSATATLGLTYLAGRRLLSPAHGLTAAAVLAAWPVAIPGPHRPTGIPLADLGRIARYDVAVPVFGLLSLLVLLSALDAEREPPRGRLIAAGALAGLATLSHAYGAAWLAVAGATLLLRRPPRLVSAALWISAGFLAALVPWMAFVATGFPDFVAQNRKYAGRLDLFSLRFYASNLTGEWRRYAPILSAARAGRIAPWVLLGAVLSGLVLLCRRVRAGAPAGSRILLAAFLLNVTLFALFLAPKTFSYLAPLWPLAALVASVPLVALFDPGKSRLVRVAALLVLALPLLEGFLAYGRLARAVHETTPYPVLAARLRERIPRDSRLLALSPWWIALRKHVATYTSLGVPFALANPVSASVPLTFAEAAAALPPWDTVLIDPAMHRFLEEATAPAHPFHEAAAAFRDLLATRGARLTATLDDPSYGRFEVWRVTRTEDTSTGRPRR
jgi:4-amino-4-deoxy-L-arabinose transferase-like glycosyltransferase